MIVKHAPKLTRGEIRQRRYEIRNSWSPAERDERQRIAEARQQWLYGMLFSQPATVSARVA